MRSRRSIATAAVVICVASWLTANSGPYPPLAGLVGYGYEATQIGRQPAKWAGDIWAAHSPPVGPVDEKGHDWWFRYSLREGKKARHKVVSDCERWMDDMDRKEEQWKAQTSRTVRGQPPQQKDK